MNKTYKVIYNRTRCMYQVVSELAKGHTKSETPEMLKSLFSKHSGLTRGIVMAVLSMSLAMPVGVAVQAADTAGTSGTMTNTSDTTTSNTSDTTTTNTNVTVKDGATLVGSGAVSVSSSTDTTKNTTTITIAVPTDGKVKANNTGLVTGGTVYTAVNAEQTARETAVKSVTDKIGTLDANGNYIQKDASVSSNLSTLDTQVKTNADAISKETTDRENAVTNVTNTVSSLSDSAVKYDTNSNKTKVTLAGEGGTTITNVKDGALTDSSTDAVTGKQLYAEQTARSSADTDLGNRITSNTTAITNLKDLSNITTAGETVIKKQAKKAVKVAATGNATVTTTGAEDDDSTLTYTINVANNGSISSGDTNLVSGGTLYTELRPASTGTYYYINNANTTAANLIALDAALNKAIAAMDIDMSDSTTYTSKLSKYFKVNPKVTTSDDGKTKTYAPDAAANGTNSVAIGPSAQAGEKTTDTTTSTTTITGGTSSTAIGDSAVANGNTSVALGANAQVLNTTDHDGKTTATITGSTAVGSGSKVNGATDATAIGTSAQVNETATGGIAFGKNAVTGEDKGTVTVSDVTANVAAVGGENSVALGTDAKASGNTALALGKGAQVNNYTTQSGTTVTKTVNSGSTAIGSSAVVTGADDAVALGTGAKVTGTGDDADDSMAIGKGASVATAKDAMSVGTSAAVASGATNAVAIGNTAKANTSNTTAIGYKASATGAGAIAIGENTSTSTEGGISIGSGTSVSGKSIAIGYSSDGVTTGSANTNAIAIGNGAQANSNDSVSIGNQAGKGTSQGRNSGYGSLIAIGTNAGANVRGMQNVAMGSGAGSNVKSSYNVAIGSNAGSGINNAGDDNNPQNGYNVSIGFGANYNKDNSNQQITESIAVGREANAASNATAIGYEATANDVRSIAIGYNTTAGHKATGTTSSDVDAGSIAIGDSAKAMGGNIAIGTSSTAPATATLGTVGDGGYIYKTTTTTGTDESTTTTTSVLKSPFTNKSLLATSTYVSVGDASNSSTRRISNVADGVFDSDAATVGQLNALNTSLVATTSNLADAEKYFDERFTTLNDNIDKIKYKYFSVSTDADTLTANQNNDGASTTSPDAMAIGPNAKASSAKAVAIGNNVSASGKGSIALGTADNPATSVTVKAGENISANPHVTSAEGANSVAIGTSAIAQTDNSVALGTRASVYTSDVIDKNTNNTVKVGQRSIAIGYESETRNSDATSIGSGAKAYSTGSTAVGRGAFAQGADSVVLGTSSTANGASSGIVGKSNTINGSNTYAVGSENNVNGNWGAVTYSGLYGSKNIVNPVSDTSGNTKHGMDSLSVTGNSNTISQGSYSDTVQNISILGNSNSITGASTDEANAGTTANITVIGGNNEVTGRDGAGSDYMGKTWNQLTRTSIIGYGNKVNQATSTTSLADTQILGNDVTATLGNSVYLGTGSSAKNANSPDTDTLTKAETDAANAVDTTGMTDDQKATALSDAKAQARYAVKLAAMKANNGSTAGTEALNTDTTYDDGTSYTYAGSSPVGVVTVGSAGGERRIQNVAAGLVSASSTDAVNGSQLYALTRQIRFGGDNSSFGKTTAAEDQNVVARGSNETISITGGSDAVTSSTADGTTTYTVDAAKLTGNNIAVVADKDANALHVQLASNLKDLNTAQLGSGSGESYKETIKLDGTGTTGGQVTLAGADGTVKTTLDTTGLTITNGPKFTSSGIDAASQQIKNVTTGTDNTDAANVGQVKSARTLLTQGTNTTLGDVEADGHHTYTVNVDNLAVKAATGNASVALAKGINFTNGTNTTSAVDSNGNVTIDTKNLTLKANGTNTASVTMDGGINFKDGTNTTAAVDNNGTVTINATHNKLRTVSAAPTGTKDDVTLTLTDADGNTVTSTGLKNTYTTVTKNGTAHTVTFARNDGTTQTVSLGDLDGASTEALNEAAAKATSEVTNGTNVASVTKTAGNNGQNIYTVTVDDLAVKTTSGEKKSVHLADGLVFADGDNTTATVGDNGTIKFNVSNDAIKKQAVQAIDVKGGSNVTVTPETNKDGTLKTFTVAASDLKYSANGTSKTTSLANGISFAAGTNTTAEIDANGAIKINATHNKLNPTGSATKATSDSNAVTLTLQDADGNTTTTGLTDTYTTVSKDATTKKVTFKRNDGETQTLDLSDLGGITAAQDKYITGGTVTYEANGNGTAALTGTNGITASITGLKDTKVASGTASYTDAQGNATVNGSATLTMNDGSTATISGLKDDYITSASVGTENNHVTMTRLGGGTVDLNLNPILEKYSLSDYHLVGNGDTQDQAYQVSADGTVTLNVVDAKNAANKKTIQITGLASQSGVNAGRTTVKSSDSSITVSDSAPNSDTHSYDIKVDYSKIPANLTVQYSGDNGTTGSNTMNTATAFSGTANQIVTTATAGKVSFKLADDISGIKSVTTGDSKLNTDGLTVTNGPTFTKSNIDANGQQIHRVTAGTVDTDAANVGQVKAATTAVKAGTNASLGTTTIDAQDNHKIYTVNVDNLALSQNDAKVGTGVVLKNGLNFKDGTNTTASVTADGKVSFSISNDAIKAQAKDAVVLTGGDNVTIGTPTDENNVKTYTVSVSDLKLQADGADKATRKLADGINFAGGTNTTADVTADGKVTYNLKDSISLNQVQTGDSTLNTNGLIIQNGPTFTKNKIDANNQQITNVVSGGDVATNAATIGDLNAAIQKASDGATASGFKTKGNYGDAVTSRLDKRLNVVGDVDTMKVAKDNLSDGNVGVVTSTDKDGNATLTVKLNKDINLGESGSVTTGSTVMSNAGITNGNMSLGANGLTIQNGPKFTNSGIDAAKLKITGVADGTADKDAVNVSQLKAVQWTIKGKDSANVDVSANIGKGKTVTYDNGNYTKAVVTEDDTTGNATVKVDVSTGTFGSDAGKTTSAADGLATTQDVANAINSASWTIQDGNNPGNAQQVKAGDKVSLKAGDNLSLDQNGKEFTYKLNKTLDGMTSVTTVDDKQNTAVLNGEGLKVSDKDGNSLTQHATEIRLHDATKAATDTTTDVVLNKQGLQNGGHTITGVANGTVEANSQDAVNGNQLYELQQKVTNGWKITGNDTTKASNIGNDKTVSFVNGDNSYIKARVDTTNTGATVSYTAQTASLTKNADGKATLNGTTDGLVTGTNLTNILNSLSWTTQSSKVGTGQNNGSTAQSITAGSQVGFIAGDNMILTQDGMNFTYALNSNLTGMNTIAFTGLGNGASNLTIGLQNGGGANLDKGYYITGLSNTKWDQSNYEGSRAATEAQLRDAIDKVSAATGTGGFGLTADEGANNGGEKKVSQTLGRTIAIQGDGTYDAEGKVVKPGNISTVAYTDNAGPTGAIKVKLNKDIDLSKEGSLTIGSSKVSAGSIVLDNTSDAAKKIALNSTAGIASIGDVMVNGAEKTVNGLSNTTWNGTAVSGRAATENQLVDAINEVKTQAANSELHIKKGVYAIGKDSQGQDITDTKGKNSVSIDVVNANGTVDGQVVINDVAKASELGTVGDLADNLKNPAGGSTTVVQAVNKVNQKVDESLTKVNGDISNAVTEAKKHTEVKSVDSDNNVTIDGTTTNTAGGTIYKLGLNKDHLNLGNVHVYGNEGRVTAKTVESETVKIDNQTRLDETGLTTGNTTVANNRIVVGGDNGIKMEANGGQQTISGLTNTDWTGTAVHGRAATEDQLAKAISSATTTAAQNEQHIKAGTYDIQTTTDDKGNRQNSVTMKIVDGTGKDKGTVTINDVAKASDVGDTDKLAADIKNQNGGQPQTTSVVEAVNNLNEKVNNRVGDNKYSAITSTDPVQDGDSSTTAIGKLNNRMNNIYNTTTQHTTISNPDNNLDIKDTTGKKDYTINLKHQISLGDVKIDGDKGSIEAKSVKADTFTSGSTVVSNSGVAVGGKTYVSSDGLNANSQKITNVQAGVADTDAVNKKQLDDAKSEVTSGYQAADAKLDEEIRQTNADLNEVGRAVNKLGNRLNRVGAGAAALAALHPGTYDPNDKWDFSAGIGHYHDANAVAIGAYYHPNDTTILSIGGSMGGGENMVNAGITWKMGRSGREQAVQPVVVRKAEAAPVVQQAAPVRPAPVVTPAPVTTPAPVKSVASTTPVQAVPAVTTPMTQTTTGDTAALAQILARQTAILEKLAQNQAQAVPSAAVAHGDDIFPDVPDNHWAYAYVAKLEKAGVLKGFKRPAVLKSPMMTRDDFASVLYTAMANGATTNPALNGDDSLNRLAQEFKAELKNVKA